LSQFIDQSIFITGAASGIGQATARLFAARGWWVGLADRNAPALDLLAVELGAKVRAFPLDVVDGPRLSAALYAFCESSGALKAIFNSAGILEMRPFSETPVERLHAIVDVNVKGVITTIGAALPFLKAHGDSRIVTMGSLSGIYGIPELGVYSATKFAVRGSQRR
jgi:NADP-dependent 3-hydroxy acid dehydrogenase YdfG